MLLNSLTKQQKNEGARGHQRHKIDRERTKADRERTKVDGERAKADGERANVSGSSSSSCLTGPLRQEALLLVSLQSASEASVSSH